MRPIVLVHGAWHGPWCWDQVADALRADGHDVTTVTLPGHDHPGDHRRIWNRISQYIGEVGDAAGRLDDPVLVGHSMGGYTVQRYLEDHTAAHAVLVASVPWRGTLRPNLRAVRRNPKDTLLALATADYSRMVGTPAHVRELFFSDETPEAAVEHATAHLQNESFLAINTMAFRRIKTARVTTPVTVIGAEDDAVFTVAEQRELAEVYGTEALILPGGHDMMLDSHWRQLTTEIARVATG